jgi:hypothetical protein
MPGPIPQVHRQALYIGCIMKKLINRPEDVEEEILRIAGHTPGKPGTKLFNE